MKENRTQTTLAADKLGDEDRVRAVLAGWGVDAPAVERMLDQHRALRARARRASGSRPARLEAAPRARQTSPGALTKTL